MRVLFVDPAHAEMALKVVADAGLNCRVIDYSTSTPGADSYHELTTRGGSEDNVEVDVDIDAPGCPQLHIRVHRQAQGCGPESRQPLGEHAQATDEPEARRLLVIATSPPARSHTLPAW